MAFNVNWGTPEQTYILVTAEKSIIPTDIMTAIGDIRVLMDSVDHKVSTIVDFTLVVSPPREVVSTFPNIAARVDHPNCSRLVVLVKVPRRWVGELFSQMYKELQFADTLEEAEAIVAAFHTRSGDSDDG